MVALAALGASAVVLTGGAVACSAEAVAAVVAGVGTTLVVGAAALVGVVADWLCWAGVVVGVADDGGDSADVEATPDVGVVESAELVTGVCDDVVPDVGLSDAGDAVEVVRGEVPGVLVGSTAGTSAADDGGTV